MKRQAAVVLLLGAFAAACTTTPGSSNAAWHYKPDSGTGLDDGPLALWGEPETLAFQVLRCNARERTLEFSDLEVPVFTGTRPIRFEAGGQAWTGEERMAPADAVAVSSFALPLGAPVVTAIGNGAPMRISGASGTMTLASPEAVQRVVRECRAAARG